MSDETTSERIVDDVLEKIDVDQARETMGKLERDAKAVIREYPMAALAGAVLCGFLAARILKGD